TVIDGERCRGPHRRSPPFDAETRDQHEDRGCGAEHLALGKPFRHQIAPYEADDTQRDDAEPEHPPAEFVSPVIVRFHARLPPRKVILSGFPAASPRRGVQVRVKPDRATRSRTIREVGMNYAVTIDVPKMDEGL